MPKMGIKVKTLAKELGVTSRAIIDRCRAEGIPVQNSLTKLDRATEQSVRKWFGGDSTSRETPGARREHRP
jgi:hypothetical protein